MNTRHAITIAAVALIPLSATPAAASSSAQAGFSRVLIPWTGGATITLVDRDVALPATPETYFGAGQVTAASQRGPSPQVDVAVKGDKGIPCPALQTGLLHVTAKTFGTKFSGTVRIFAYTNSVLDGSILDEDGPANGTFTRNVTVAHDDSSTQGPRTMTLLKICAPDHG